MTKVEQLRKDINKSLEEIEVAAVEIRMNGFKAAPQELDAVARTIAASTDRIKDLAYKLKRAEAEAGVKS